MNNLIEIKTNIQPSKALAAEMTSQIVSLVTDGNINPLEAYSKATCMATAFENAKEQLKPIAFEYLNSNPEKVIELYGSKFTKTEVGGKWNYDNCQDPIYVELKEKLAERERFLKGLPISGFDWVNTETGETIKLFPPTKIGAVSTFKTELGK